MVPVQPTVPPAIRCEHLSGGVEGAKDAVHDLTLEVAAGEFVTLLGPARAGKSAALMVLAGLAAPSQGQVFMAGRPVTRTAANRRGLGVVFARSALSPRLTVAGNLAFPLALRGVRRAPRREQVARLLSLLRLEGVANRRPGQLDAVARLRAALARAVLFDPACVLLDDPLAVLERTARVAFWAELRRVQRALGIAMLLATRDPAEALAVSDRVAVLRGGVLRQVDRPETVYEHPSDPLVAGILGETNTLEGRIRAIDGNIATVRLRGGPMVEARVSAEVAEAGVVGERCVVCVRPERIALVVADAVQMGENALAAVVEEIVYQGDHTRLRLVIGEGTDLVVKRPAAAGPARLAVGRPAAVAWQPGHALVFRLPG